MHTHKDKAGFTTFCSIGHCQFYSVAYLGGFSVCNKHYEHGLWIAKWVPKLYNKYFDKNKGQDTCYNNTWNIDYPKLY